MSKTTTQQETKADLTRRATRRMRRAVLASLLRAGYVVTVENGAAEEVSQSGDLAELMRSTNQTDHDYLYVYEGGKCIGWVLLVYGNQAYELVADYTTNLEVDLEPVWELSHRLDLMDL